MLLKNLALRTLSVLFLITILLIGVLLVPVQAKSSARPLQADGDFAWAGAFTGLGDGHIRSSAVDASGNVYTAGYFDKGTFDFDPGPGTANLTKAGLSFFISKLDSDGNFVWVKDITGNSIIDIRNMTVDTNGNIYTTGVFQYTADLDPGPGTFNLTSANGAFYVSKLDSAGNFVWAIAMDGSGSGLGLGITTDANGNVYTTGTFQGTVDFDPGAGTANLTAPSGDTGFVSKLDTDGNYVWAKIITEAGSNTNAYAVDIAVDTNGNVYTTGLFKDTVDFDPGAGTANLTAVGNYDIFVSKLDGAGNYVWAKSAGGPSDDYAEAIAVDIHGSVHISGEFKSTVDFDPGAGTYTLSTSADFSAFVWSLDSDGNFAWANNLGNNQFNIAWDIAVDSTGTFVYIVGYFVDTVDFDSGPGTANLTSAGVSMFICKLTTYSGTYIWAKQVGAIALGLSVGLDATDKLYTTGTFMGTMDFDPGPGTTNLTSLGATYNMFVMKFDNSATFPTNPPTMTPIPSSTWTPSPVPTASKTATNTVTASLTVTAAATHTATESPTGTMTATATASVIASPSGTGTFTPSPSPTVTQTATPAAVTISLPSNALQDGWILELSENSNTGDNINNTDSIVNLGDNAAKKQYRSILSFETGILPDTAVITSVTLKLKQRGITGGGNPVSIFNGLMIDIKNGFFGSAATLQATDFQAVASKTYGPTSPALVGGFYNINLSNGKAFINKLAVSNGLTQIRLRFKLDDNNNTVTNLLSLYSGNASITKNRPQLVITYYVP